MYVMRMYDKSNGYTIGLFPNTSIALECIKLSWQSFESATFTLNIDGITVERKGFDPIKYGFEPMRVITNPEHL